MRVTLEPRTVLLRPQERAPILALGHYTNGVSAWSEHLAGYTVTVDDEQVAYVKDGVIYAKGFGKTTLRLANDGLYAATTVHVAAHPAGTAADVLTGLPPVAGIAWANGALIVSTRTSELWRLGPQGVYEIAAGVPLQPPSYSGTDTLAASANGDIAMRLVGHPDVLVLESASNYRRSRWITPAEAGTIMAMTWNDTDNIFGLDTGLIIRVRPDGTSGRIAALSGPITSIDCADEELLAVTKGADPGVWRIPLSGADAGEATRIVTDGEPHDLNVVAWLNGHAYFTDFHGGRVLRLEDGRLIQLAPGLHTPGELAAGPEGSVYVAEFERGAILRLLP
jgi:hypothetical protein